MNLAFYRLRLNILLIFTVVFCCGDAIAAKIKPNIALRHILTDELESFEYIESIAQDALGFMWFGGRNGLGRFDGYSVTRFEKSAEEHSINSNQINEILLKSDDTLWIATGQGLHSYDAELERFNRHFLFIDDKFDRASNEIKAIIESADGGLWLGTRAGLIHYNPTLNSFTRYYIEPYPPGKGETVINVLFKDEGGRIWMGQRTGGLTVFNPDDATFQHYRHDPDDSNSISDNNVQEVMIDSQKNIWIGTYKGGLNRLTAEGNFTRYPFSKRKENEDVWEIIEDKKGQIWVGDGGGLALYDKDTDSFHRFGPDPNDPRSLRHSSIRSMFMDNAGDLWISFVPSGVDYLDPQASVFRNYMSAGGDTGTLLGNSVRATYVDDDSNLWIATGLGLSHLNREENSFTNYQYEENREDGVTGLIAMSVTGDRDGNIWFGIWNDGLNRLDRKTGKITHYPPSKTDPTALLGGQPYGVIVDHKGELWVGTNEGVNRYNKDTDTFTSFKPPAHQRDGENRFYTRAIYEDSKHNLWIGSTRGLFKFDRAKEEFTRYKSEPNNHKSLSVNFVLCMYDDGNGSLWLGTKGGGLNRYDYETDTVERVHHLPDLESSIISSVISDDQGDIWLATQNGLKRYNPKARTLKTYTKTHGLSGNLFSRNTLSKTPSGEIVAGNIDGLTIFNPKDLWDNDYIPPVWITDFSIFNERVKVGTEESPLQKSIIYQDRVKLSHEQSVFSVTFSALNYRSPEENTYQYMLEGFDKNWHPASKRRTATYTNLDPGEYIMRVRAANNNGVWNNTGTSLIIEVEPPFYRSTLAYTFYSLIAMAIIFFVIQFNIRRQTYEREHKLNQSLRNLDKLKDEFLANTSHELRTPLNGIIGLSETMLDDVDGEMPAEQKRNYLKMIHFSGKRLSNLVDDILDFSKLKSHTLNLNKQPVKLKEFVKGMMIMLEPLIGNKPLKLVNNIPSYLPDVNADEKRLQQIFFNLVGNAIKFTDSGSVSINAKQVKNAVVIDIVDTGIGIPDDKLNKIFESFEQVESDESRMYGGTGLGLTITQKLVELHGGSISVSSKTGEGSRFSIQLPVHRAPQQP